MHIQNTSSASFHSAPSPQGEGLYLFFQTIRYNNRSSFFHGEGICREIQRDIIVGATCGRPIVAYWLSVNSGEHSSPLRLVYYTYIFFLRKYHEVTKGERYCKVFLKVSTRAFSLRKFPRLTGEMLRSDKRGASTLVKGGNAVDG